MSVFVLVDDADEGIEYSPVSENAYKGKFNLSQIVDGWAVGAIGAYRSMKYMLYETLTITGGWRLLAGLQPVWEHSLRPSLFLVRKARRWRTISQVRPGFHSDSVVDPPTTLDVLNSYFYLQALLSPSMEQTSFPAQEHPPLARMSHSASTATSSPPTTIPSFPTLASTSLSLTALS